MFSTDIDNVLTRTQINLLNQWHILKNSAGGMSPTIAEVARSLDITPNAVQECFKRIEAKGVINIPKKRARGISLTDLGKRLFVSINTEINFEQEEILKIFSKLSATQKQQAKDFISNLSKI